LNALLEKSQCFLESQIERAEGHIQYFFIYLTENMHKNTVLLGNHSSVAGFLLANCEKPIAHT